MFWRMLVTTPAGGTRDSITPADAIESLPSFSVDAVGSCLEGEFIARADSVGVRPRDVITLETSEDESTWAARYRGVVVQAGNQRSPDLQSYRVVGLRERFYEIPLTARSITGADVAAMVDSVLGGMTLPEGVTYNAADAPTTHFQLGARYPQLESVGDFLDALAESVGAFTVPTGESYTYDGRTYYAGEVVPRVMWGVRADGAFVFRRPQAAPVTVSEAATTADVEWLEVSAEDTADRVTLVYASEYNGTPDIQVYGVAWGNSYAIPFDPPIGQPIYREFGSGDYHSTRVIPLDAPLDAMAKVAVTLVSSSDIDSVSNATDDKDGTHASATNDAATGTWVVEHQEAVLELVFQKGHADSEMWFLVLWQDPAPDNYWRVAYWLRLEGLRSTEKQWLYLPLLLPVRVTTSPSTWRDEFRVSVLMNNNSGSPDRVYEIRAYVPDCDTNPLAQPPGSPYGTVSERLAASLTRPVREHPGVITLHELSPVTQTVDLKPITGSAMSVDVARTEYAITTTEGVSTRYHLEHEYPAEQLSERVVLERLARRATKGAA